MGRVEEAWAEAPRREVLPSLPLTTYKAFYKLLKIGILNPYTHP